MNSDSAFVIGATHQVCEDYAVAGGRPRRGDSDTHSPGEPYVIVSDGCSSSPDTDTGARLLVKAAERLILDAGRPPAGELRDVYEEAARVALGQAEMIGLPPQAVDATLLTIHLAGGSAVAACYGDGVVALRKRGGQAEVYSISYPAGYPLYPAYAHQRERLQSFKGLCGNTKEVRRYVMRGGGPLELVDCTSSDARLEVFTAPPGEYELAAVLTDGAHSFSAAFQTDIAKRVEAVPLGEVLAALLCFKSTGGAFVARRLKRFAGDCRTRGWRHADDLAVGAVHLRD